MSDPISLPTDYAVWLAELKTRIRSAQQRATVAVNRELVLLYWHIGRGILERQGREGWGAKVIERLAQDLRGAFPDAEFVQQAAAQLPWFHLCVLIDKLKTPAEREWYLAKTIEHGWSRNMLVIHIERRLRETSGQALTNFTERLPAPLSDLARESLKDPYRLDFLGLGEEAQERSLEEAIVHHITRFLLELGSGFAFVGRQVHIEVGGEDFFIDLLFYHLKLRCYVVVELKAGAFRPEHAGQLSFYLSAVDAGMKTGHEGPTIGLLLCKSKNKVVAEYALRDSSKPIGVAEYRLIAALPVDMQASLPSIEALEQALAGGPGEGGKQNFDV